MTDFFVTLERTYFTFDDLHFFLIKLDCKCIRDPRGNMRDVHIMEYSLIQPIKLQTVSLFSDTFREKGKRKSKRKKREKEIR